VVREARSVLAKVWHPDRHQGDAKVEARAQVKLQEINEAYSVIEVAGFPSAEVARLSETASATPPAPMERLPRLRWQLVQEGKQWAIAHLDDVAHAGRADELDYWATLYERGVPASAFVPPPPYGKRRSRLSQYAFDAMCAERVDGRALLEKEFLHYLVPAAERSPSARPEPRKADPPEHAARREAFLVWKIGSELNVVSSWFSEQITFKPDGPLRDRAKLAHIVGWYCEGWQPPDVLIARSTSSDERRTRLAPAVARLHRLQHLFAVARSFPMALGRTEQNLDWCEDMLEAASYAAGQSPRLPPRAYGLRDDLEAIQFAFLDRFQPDGNDKMIEVVRRVTGGLSERDANEAKLIQFARATSVLEPMQGTDFMLRFPSTIRCRRCHPSRELPC
jgi:hypothetical protein